MKELSKPKQIFAKIWNRGLRGYNPNLVDLGLTAWMISKLLCLVFKCVLECACSVFLHCIVSPQPFHIFCFPTAFIRPVSFSAIVILKETGFAVSFSAPNSYSCETIFCFAVSSHCVPIGSIGRINKLWQIRSNWFPRQPSWCDQYTTIWPMC